MLEAFQRPSHSQGLLLQSDCLLPCKLVGSCIILKEIRLVQLDTVPTQETSNGLRVSHKCFTVSTP